MQKITPYLKLIAAIAVFVCPIVLLARLICPDLSDGICAVVGLMAGYYANEVEQFFDGE